MAVAEQDIAVRTTAVTRVFIYGILLIFMLFYLMPLFVMVANSLKPLAEITGGNMMALPCGARSSTPRWSAGRAPSRGFPGA